MFNVHTVERVNEPQVGYACCCVLEQLQQAVINTGTRPRLAHPPISRVLIENAPFFLSFSTVLNLRTLREKKKNRLEGERKCMFTSLNLYRLGTYTGIQRLPCPNEFRAKCHMNGMLQ